MSEKSLCFIRLTLPCSKFGFIAIVADVARNAVKEKVVRIIVAFMRVSQLFREVCTELNFPSESHRESTIG